MNKNQIKDIYHKLMEEDVYICAEIKETDTEIIQVFEKYYKGTENMEDFRDEIFGIITKAREQSFYHGFRYIRALITEEL